MSDKEQSFDGDDKDYGEEVDCDDGSEVDVLSDDND